MAKKTTTTQASKGRGLATKAERVSRLETALGTAGVKRSEKIISDFSHDEIRLAALRIPTVWRQAGLGKRIESMLATMDAKTANEMRAKLTEAKAAVKD